METKLITQPFDKDDNHQTLGAILSELLSSDSTRFDSIWIVSAFANQRGVQHLAPLISKAKERGAEIHFVIGIDHRSTTIEALREILAFEVDSRIVHNLRPGHTFHPKIYLFEVRGKQAKLLIGSNNLTEGGLFTNYEALVLMTFNLPKENTTYLNFKASLEKFLEPKGSIVQLLSEGLIKTLADRKEIVTEEERRHEGEQAGSTSKRRSKTRVVSKSPFGSEKIKAAPRLAQKRTRAKRKHPSRQKRNTAIRGALIWQKVNLPASDVQKQAGNVTGGLRLTQAGWGIKGKPIDQTTFFRVDIFGHLQWSRGVLTPKKREAVKTSFDVNILGQPYGLHELTISHKPSGEAGQGNYTTMLHWGDLGPIIQKLDLLGKTFRLYAPPEGSPVPFFIEII